VLAVAALMAMLAVASTLAGIPRLAFLDVLMAHGIPAFDRSVEDADAEIAAAQRVDHTDDRQ
jgi:predicted HTH domain antitoxin